jgi:hypothetical protein
MSPIQAMEVKRHMLLANYDLQYKSEEYKVLQLHSREPNCNQDLQNVHDFMVCHVYGVCGEGRGEGGNAQPPPPNVREKSFRRSHLH